MKIKYLVDKQKGVVKAVAEFDSKYVQGVEPAIINIIIKKFKGRKSKLLLPKNLVGVARLHPDDNFNEELGKQIAKERLLATYNNRCGNILCEYYEGLKEIEKFAKYKASKSYKERNLSKERAKNLLK